MGSWKVRKKTPQLSFTFDLTFYTFHSGLAYNNNKFLCECENSQILQKLENSSKTTPVSSLPLKIDQSMQVIQN